MAEKNRERVPKRAMLIADDGAVFKFQASAEEGSPNQFRVLANSGAVLSHPFWGNFALDMNGLDVGREDKPILRDHDPTQIVGHTKSIRVTEEGIVAEGTITESTDAGREVLKLANEGFPWQASVYVPGDRVERVAEGETAEVNGQTLTGPGTVFRTSRLREVTITALGADENTSAMAMLDDGEVVEVEIIENQERLSMDEKDKQPQEQAGAVVDEDAVKAAVLAERERCAKIRDAAWPGQEEIVDALLKEGVEYTEALERLNAHAKVMREARLSEIEKQAPPELGTDDAALIKEDADEPKKAPETADEAWSSLTRSQRDEFAGRKEIFEFYFERNDRDLELTLKGDS